MIKAIIASILLWFGIFVLAGYACAEPRFAGQQRIVVDTVGVVNPWLKPSVDKRMTRDAVNIIRATGIRYTRGKFSQVADPFETPTGGRLYPEQLGQGYNAPFIVEFSYWWARLGGYVPNNHIELVTTPPWLFDGKGEWKDGAVPYFGGRAELAKAKSGCVAYASAAEYGIGGAPKYRQSLIGRVHELLHCGGAEHIDGQVNMMHPAAGQFAAGNINVPILPYTVEQVVNYLK